MAENSKINWTTHTFNPWIGCTKVSPGCLHCYAETLMDTRYGRVKWGAGNPRSRTAPSNWKKVRSWNNHVRSGEERPRVFCASLADWLDDEVPIEWFVDLMDLVRTTPNLDWLLLTKRPQNWFARIAAAIEFTEGPHAANDFPQTELGAWLNEWSRSDGEGTPANVWVGTTVEDQTRADLRIPQLLAIPAKVSFLSCEPLLDKIDVVYPESLFPGGPKYCCSGQDCGCQGQPIDPPLIYGINWVICGGESGPGAREMSAAWAESLRMQCSEMHVAFWMKQMGGTPNPRHEIEEMPTGLRVRELPNPPSRPAMVSESTLG